MTKSLLEYIQAKMAGKEEISEALIRKKKKKRLVRKPFHTYHTKDGHLIHVHVKKDKSGGGSAYYYNQNLGNELVGSVHWFGSKGQPSKKELETAHHDNN